MQNVLLYSMEERISLMVIAVQDTMMQIRPKVLTCLIEK